MADVAARKQRSVDNSSLPPWQVSPWQNEFSQSPSQQSFRRALVASLRIVRIAIEGALEPSAMALLAASVTAVVSIGACEGYILCASEQAHVAFVARYAVEQVLPSCVWSTQDAGIIATAMGLDPAAVLQHLDPTVEADARTILHTKNLAATRYMVAGFMMLTQLVRVGTIGAKAPTIFQERLKRGREPPILLPAASPLIIRLCGRRSDVTATSLRRMGSHLLPVYEESERVSHLLYGKRYPLYWCIPPGRYGQAYRWRDFPVDKRCFLKIKTEPDSVERNVLLLEADATNSDDPLALGDLSLDLTIDDASQGFRRIEELYRHSPYIPPFQTMRVFLGNSLEIAKSGGGHAYTLRHRVRYAKEADVLIDSRAPVLQEILKWCSRVAGKDRRILCQTSSEQYFWNLQLLMANYGYKIYDPLDWRMLDEFDEGDVSESDEHANKGYESLLQVLVNEQFMEYGRIGDTNDESRPPSNDDKKVSIGHRLRQVTRLSRLPRIVYYGNTAETVNAVQSLVNAGEVEVSSCCAIVDKEEGMNFLAKVVDEQVYDHTQWEQKATASQEDATHGTSKCGLHIVCSSLIYDDLFRQVREWKRLGYAAKDIQTRLDTQFEDILQQTREIRETMTEASIGEGLADEKVEPFVGETAAPLSHTEEQSKDEQK